MATPSYFVRTEDKAMITVPCRISSREEKQFVAYHYCYVLRLTPSSPKPHIVFFAFVQFGHKQIS